MFLLLTLFSKLPMITIQKIAQLIGGFLFTTHASARKVTEINLKIAYPELNQQQIEDLAKESLKSQVMSYAEFIKIWGSSTDYAESQITKVHGEEILLNAIKANQGVIAVIPHLGTWELLNVWLNQHASPVIMYKPSPHKNLNRFMLESRQRLNANMVPTDENGVRAIFKHLKKGGLTAILPDHIPKESGGIYSMFYGQDSFSSTLVSKLASKTQCAVIGLTCIRNKDLSGFEIFVSPMSMNILSKNTQISVDHLNQELEFIINTSPENYVWSYKRFRKILNKPNPYKSESL